MTLVTWDGFWGWVEADPAALRGYRLANAGAVPRTGRRHRRYCWIRRPRHIGILRTIAADGGHVHGENAPPTNYDDIAIAANRSRNWKRHRRTQWHEGN